VLGKARPLAAARGQEYDAADGTAALNPSSSRLRDRSHRRSGLVGLRGCSRRPASTACGLARWGWVRVSSPAGSMRLGVARQTGATRRAGVERAAWRGRLRGAAFAAHAHLTCGASPVPAAVL
jgi:hypothetical protein